MLWGSVCRSDHLVHHKTLKRRSLKKMCAESDERDVFFVTSPVAVVSEKSRSVKPRSLQGSNLQPTDCPNISTPVFMEAHVNSINQIQFPLFQTGIDHLL